MQHHSFATGGHGKNEYFGQPDKLNPMVDGRTGETCNVYNMLKMTRTLFALRPDIRYADFHERALFNHILGSMDPKDGWTCYMVPVGRGVSTSTSRTCSTEASPAAWDRAWRATPCTATASTTSRATGSG